MQSHRLTQSTTGQPVALLPVPLNGTTPLLAHGVVLNHRLEADECIDLIKNAERCAEFRGGWRTKRHDSYPTTDLDLFIDFPAYVSIHILKKLAHIKESIKSFYKIPEQLDISIKDLFIARYSDAAQSGLNVHLDGTTFSFVVNLSSSSRYIGGGTIFPDISPNASSINTDKKQNTGQVIKLDEGQIIIFPGGLIPHGASSVEEGSRYILAGFVEFTHAQRGLDVHIQHKAKIITSAVSSLANELKELVNAFSQQLDDKSNLTKKPVLKHKQLYDKYLSLISDIEDSWGQLLKV